MNKKIPIVVQLMVVFSTILLITISLISYFSIKNSSEVVLVKTSEYLQESVIQLKGKIDVNLMEFDKVSQTVAFHPVLQEYLIYIQSMLEFHPNLQEHFANIIKEESSKRNFEIDRIIGEQSRFIKEDYFIQVIDNAGIDFDANNTLFLPQTLHEMKNKPWFDTVDEFTGRMVWIAGDSWRNEKILPSVIGARQINDVNQLDHIGYLFTVFPIQTLERLVGEVNFGTSGKVQIVDRFGNVIYSEDKSQIGTQVEAGLLNMMKMHQDRMIEWEVDGEITYISHTQSDYSGWTFMVYVDIEEAFKDLENIEDSLFLIGMTGIISALIFILFFSWSISKPISKLAVRLNRLGHGPLEPYKGFMENKEIDMLYHSYNQMQQDLKQTIKDLSDKQISEKHAQLIALKAQFKPHFLYNTLNTIYWELINEGQYKTANMVLSLSDLLRYSIQPGSELVTIDEDLKHLNHFLDILKARYGEKLKVEINVNPESVLTTYIMKLLLQPLVENAISHGLEPKRMKEWIIHIQIYREDNHIHFIVEDNGIGMTESEMEKIEHAEIHAEMNDHNIMHSGIGISNLRYRIQLIYGKDYGMKLSQSTLGGLKVNIKLPIKKDKS
ncbi:sensor histidine kinase [Chengkuizengella axinellae]|uniref:Sensor histidine kinase n=1 Tax=Chengkuizengella axinellae TaxID=3064388 RepID=A0ABT9J2D2_9BACL|nr:sensor histidine kinase [Chengkuizengella sp. 2205SS18-9]MDP5275159.1 sensor histidine kinase [Chengkuizengella sp. 2205SS18-9]